jgi:WD40 repeat protein
MFTFALLAGLMAGSAVLAQNQDDRRERKEPGLILETPGRMASCDVLTFVRDNSDLYLLAAGDDKVVIVWKVEDNKLVEKRRLRWGIYREQRGVIYSAAAFRDRAKKLKIALAGWGRETGQVAILDFETGAVDHVLDPQDGNVFAVWSLAASPGGEQIAWGAGDGTVWVWHPGDKKASPLGGPLPPREKRSANNRAHFLTYTGEHRLVSSTHDGRVVEWDTSRPSAKGHELFSFDMDGVWMAVLSPDRKWIAARGDSRKVEIRSFPDGRSKKEVGPLPEGTVPQAVAFDPDGQRLAVGVSRNAHDSAFLYELNGEVQLYDIGGARPKMTGRLPMTLYADVLAFDPSGQRLAVAGGDNHDVTLWDVASEKVLFRLPTPGHCLWNAALSKDGKLLGVKDHRRGTAPQSPNERGAGEYHVFNLGLGQGRRDWTDGKDFHPVEPVETLGGWKVEIDSRDPLMGWYAVGPDKRRHKLVLSRATDDFPRCYTFVKATGDKPIRLAVGHYWGISLYEMDPRGKWTDKQGNFHRCRLYVGHQGYVTSVAPSADHTLLVSASRDMTVNCWSLADWPRQAELGVDFAVRANKLVVKGTDPGSPAWQAGFAKGTEVELIRTEHGAAKGGPERWLELIEETKPGEGLVFRYKNPGDAEEKLTLFTARQRPIWRFFPSFEPGANGRSVPQDWVLWRWQDYFYDASTNGDRYVGWQMSGDPKDPPVYYPAERMRERFLNPGKVRDTLAKGVSDPQHVQFRDIEPPTVTIKAAAAAVKDAAATFTVEAKKVGVGGLQNLDRVEIWVNDRYLAETLGAAKFVGGNLPPTPITINPGDLQIGENTVKAIAINKADGRGEAVATVKFTSDKRRNPVLHVLTVGISDYSHTKPKQNNLSGAGDAKLVRDLWLAQRNTKLYDGVDVLPPLLDAAATPKAILEALAKLKDEVKPDDQFVLFLAGHGDAEKDVKTREYKPGSFFYVGPYFDEDNIAGTTLSSHKLYDALAKLSCHQLVLLDACHAGDVASNPLQDLRRNGVGAVILAACKNSQVAYEDPEKERGFFLLALEEAIGKDFKADRGGKGVIEPADLAEYIVREVPRLLHKADPTLRQDPAVSPWATELSAYHRKLAKKPE